MLNITPVENRIQPAMAELDEGMILDGRYEILARIGSGGEANLYRARDLNDDAAVALKMLRLVGKYARRRFLREFEVLSEIRHPRIVRPRRLGMHSGKPYFSMDYISGSPVSDLIARPADLERLRTTWLLPLIRQICEGLAYIHARGIVHRDVKSSNIMVSEVEGRPVVTILDLSLARRPDSEETPETPQGRPSGTLEYTSPEQIRTRRTDERSDLYSLGVVLYEILAGRPPFTAENRALIANMHLRDEPSPLRLCSDGAASKIEAAVMRLLEKEPADRYRSVETLLHDLSDRRDPV